ncbi:MAG: ORF6N domain-containing protein, partial [Selenomonadaceae bacterium]|nr:ORF6N domain-containing protein [Selenomonadaceae bacterium]
MKNIKDLVPVDYSNQRVLTTAQLAEVYGVEPTRIRDNFRKAKKHFVEGEHYFKLEGEKLKVFKERVEEIMFSFSPVKGSGKDAETFRSAGGYKIQNPLFNITRSLLLWTHEGCVRHCKMLRKPDAFAIFEELKRTYFEVGNKLIVPQIVTVQGIKGYVDKKGVAWLNVDDVAFKLGISQTKNGVEYVRYERINEWIREYGFSPEVGKGDYVPEHVVYLLAMKANNDTAKAFQLKIATEILPSIRKYGYYISEQAMQGSLFPDEEPVKKIARRPVPELAFVYGLKLSNGLTKIGVAKDLTAR